MRALLLTCIVVGSMTAWAGPKDKLAVLEIEVVASGRIATEDANAAAELTRQLSTIFLAKSSAYTLVQPSEQEWSRAKQRANCDRETTPCLVKLAADLGIDLVVYGHAQRVKSRTRDGYDVTLTLLSVAKRTTTTATSFASVSDVKDAAFAKQLFGRLGALSAPPAPCDFDTPKKLGFDAAERGNLAGAITKFEEALACKYDPAVVARLFLAACRAGNAVKAQQYYPRLPPAQQNLKQACVRAGVSLAPVPPAPVHTGPKRKLAVPGIEVLASSDDDPGLESFAAELTQVLRGRAKAGVGGYELAPDTDRELVRLKRHTNCASEQPDCLIVIAKELAGEALMFGKVENAVEHGARGYRVSLMLLEAANTAPHSRIEFVPLTSVRTWMMHTAPAAYAELAGVPKPPASPLCKPAFEQQADQHVLDGNHAQALSSYERAYTCTPSVKLYDKMFVAACNARTRAKAKLLYSGLSNKSYVQACLRNGIDPR